MVIYIAANYVLYSYNTTANVAFITQALVWMSICRAGFSQGVKCPARDFSIV